MFKDTRLASIDRRSFLRGLGSTMVALPFFEFFADVQRAHAQNVATPKRFLFMRMGESPSTDGDSVLDVSGRVRNFLCPASYGPAYGLTDGIAQLASYPQLRPYLGFYSGMDLPWLTTGNPTLAQIPPGGFYDSGFHNINGYSYVTGRRSFVHDNYAAYGYDRGPSADYAMKLAFDPQNRLQHININGQPGIGQSRGLMTYDGAGQGLSPNDSPRLMFTSLFSNVTSGPTTVVDPVAKLAIDQRRSILDLLDRDRLTFLKRELSKSERANLAIHLDEIRELELRAMAVPVPTMPGGVCQKPADPGADPGSTTTTIINSEGNSQSISDSGEDRRIDVFIDLVAMAMACDISRFGSFRLCGDQPVHFNSHFITGYNIDVHQVGHYGAPLVSMQQICAWASGKFFKLAEALRNKREGAGNVLDNTALVYITDGSSDDGVRKNSNNQRIAGTHSHGNHVLMVAGKAGGLKTGTHVALPGKHPATVLLAGMRACGYQGNLGDLTAHPSEVL